MNRVGTTAFCWRLERGDGVTIGLTSHDRDLVHDGLVYRAAPGMLPSAVSLGDGFASDAMEAQGALSSLAIRADDLEAGRWDGAGVRLFALDWEAPQGPAKLLARGEIGEVRRSETGFTAQLRGPAAVLDAPVAEATSPECRASLGDRRCRVDLAPLTHLARVAAVVAEDVVETDAVGGFAYGRLRWREGRAAGVSQLVTRQEGARLWLRGLLPWPPAVGARVELVEGCDRSFATCRDRFRNSANFRGEPHLPGNDLLMRYPGA